MDILRKNLGILLALMYTLPLVAQTENPLQTAFKNSYLSEYNQQYTDAITALTAVYEEKSYECNLRLGWLHYLNKDYPKSRSYYQKAATLKPYSVEAKLGLAQPLGALQSTDKLESVYKDILKIDPQNSTANYWMGVIAYNRKKFEEAARYFEKVVNLYPFDYGGNHMLAWTYFNLGRSNEAKILFNKALLNKPGDASCIQGLALIK